MAVVEWINLASDTDKCRAVVRAVSWTAEQLLQYQDGFCSMQLVNYVVREANWHSYVWLALGQYWLLWHRVVGLTSA